MHPGYMAVIICSAHIELLICSEKVTLDTLIFKCKKRKYTDTAHIDSLHQLYAKT